MAIDVQIKCSDCGTVSDKVLHADDTEIVCPECRRNMSNLNKEEFNAVSRSLSTQRVCGVLALLFAVGAAVLLYFYVGAPLTWVSSDSDKHLKQLAEQGLKRDADNSMYLIGAAVCLLASAVAGVLGSLKRYIVEF